MDLQLITSELAQRGLSTWSNHGQQFEITHHRLGEIPYYLARTTEGTPAPAVFLQHGLRGSKDSALAMLASIAEQGYTAVALDARLHGERQPDDLEARLERERFIETFFNIVHGTCLDIATLLTHLQAAGSARPGDAGISGFSMGGYITFMLPLTDSRFCVAAPTAGSPAWSSNRQRAEGITQELLDQIERFNPITHLPDLRQVAWLVQHGEADEVVPTQGSKLFCQQMQGVIAHTDRLQCITYPGVEHDLVPGMVQATIAWFKRHLPA